jgi:type I restriction enzyme, S subunit
MNSWRETTMGELLKVEHGFAFKGEHFSENGDYVVLTPGNFHEAGGFRERPDKDRFYQGKFPDRYLLKRNDLIVAMTEQGEGLLGSSAFILASDKYLHNQRLGLVRAKRDAATKTFLYYLFNTDYVRQQIRNSSSGAKVRHTSPERIYHVKVLAPAKRCQQKIAAILSAYDELIENNKRRIALLEKMAEEIYREWFVRLRFPGHEKVKIVKGVPEGWEMVKLEQAFKYTGGGTPSKEVDRYWKNGDVNWFTPSDITAAQGMFLECSGEQCTEEGVNNSSARMFPAYSIMLTSRATIGAIGINLTPACTNQGFITCIPNSRYPLAFLYHWLKFSKPHFELLAGGATFAELTKGTFKRIEILTPPEPIVTKFDELESPIFKTIETHLRENEKLVETRVRLLPRLISGKLSVENLDIQFPPSMVEELEVVA